LRTEGPDLSRLIGPPGNIGARSGDDGVEVAPERFFLLRLRFDSKAVGNPVHEVEVRYQHDGIENIAVAEARGLQVADVVLSDAARSPVQLAGKLQQGAILPVQIRQGPVVLL